MRRAFPFRTHFTRVSESRFFIGQDLFLINESLTLDSSTKLDSNRCDSEVTGVLPDKVQKSFPRGPKAWRAHTRRARASNPIRSRDWRNRSQNRPITGC